MHARSRRRRRKAPKRRLAIPDLEHAKTAVINSLTSRSARRTYDHAIREFVTWYCSEPRLAFNRTVVLRYRIHLEQQRYAASTINLRLAAVRRIAYEAADAGLLSPELAASIRRVKGVRRLGVRLGNWLTVEEGRRLVAPRRGPVTRRAARDQAMLALLIGCGLRRGEVLALTVDSFQQREGHWAIVDLVGKAGHVRTVPVPGWVKAAVDTWITASGVTSGRVFRAVHRTGGIWARASPRRRSGTSSSAPRRAPASIDWRPTTCGERAPVCAIRPTASSSRSSSCSAMCRSRRPSGTSGASSNCGRP